MATCKNCGKKGFFLKVNFDGLCLDCERQAYAQRIHELEISLSPEQQNVEKLKAEIVSLNNSIKTLKQEIDGYNNHKATLTENIKDLSQTITDKKTQIIELDDTILLQEFGLYEPTFEFCHAEDYKNKLTEIRNRQKELIRQDLAATGSLTLTFDGSLSKGKKVVNDTKKLLLRAFNNECDDVVNKVKYNNIESSLKKIESSRNAISRLGKMMDVSIRDMYYNLKVDEIHLALEYQLKKQEEKDAQRELKEQEREAKKLAKEIELARKKAEKEQNHYLNALSKIMLQLEKASDSSEKDELAKKKIEIESTLSDIEKSLKDIDYREANQRAGYVYIISNIGAFGENIYKIGMTRRLDPTERIDELGDASVPFKFDIHAMLFSDDAPKLENALHKAFEDRKLNMVNSRREFFNVTLNEIKEVVKNNYDKTADFIDVAEAEQFRVSLKMKEQLKV